MASFDTFFWVLNAKLLYESIIPSLLPLFLSMGLRSIAAIFSNSSCMCCQLHSYLSTSIASHTTTCFLSHKETDKRRLLLQQVAIFLPNAFALYKTQKHRRGQLYFFWCFFTILIRWACAAIAYSWAVGRQEMLPTLAQKWRCKTTASKFTLNWSKWKFSTDDHMKFTIFTITNWLWCTFMNNFIYICIKGRWLRCTTSNYSTLLSWWCSFWRYLKQCF